MAAWEQAPLADAAPKQPAWMSAPVENAPDDMAVHRQRLADATAALQQEQADAAKDSGVGGAVRLYGRVLSDTNKGTAEIARNIGSQLIATPVAGIAGIAQGAKNLISDDPTNMSAGDRVLQVQNALTYQPRSEAGKTAQAMIEKPFELLAKGADWAGQKSADATNSPAVGAIVNTAVQSVPALLTRRGGPLARGATAEESAASAGEAASATKAATEAATARAQNYARTNGIDWNSLSDEIKGKLSAIAQDATQLNQLDPVALAREAKFQSLPKPVPATAGQLSRDPVALRQEAAATATPEGQPIRDIHLAANQALLDNLDVLKGKVSGTGSTAATATTPEQVGAAVQGAARAKELASKKNYQALYKKAEETQPDAQTSIAPVTDLLQSNPEIQHLGWVQSWINKASKLNVGADGEPVAKTTATLKELNDLRSQASEIARTGGKEGLYAGKVVGAIDSAMQEVPEGAEAWRAANQAFKSHKLQFSEQGAIADLVDNASRTDRVTALENTAKTITNGSLEDVRKVKETLLTGGDSTTRTAGRQAWRDVRTQVIEGIKNDATKGVALNADGSPNLTAAGLKSAIDRYGPEKLDEIFGPGTTKQLYNILDVARDSKTMPPTAVNQMGSGTVANILSFLSKGLDKVPVAGVPVVNLARGVAKLKNIGANARTAKTATTTPLNEVLDKATSKANSSVKNAERVKQLRREANMIPLSEIGSQRDQATKK